MGLNVGIMTIPTQFRGLKDDEFAVLKSVFQHVLPPRREIFITDGTGFGQRPFTVPGAFLTAVFTTACNIHLGPFALAASAAISVLSSWGNYGYFINVGPVLFDSNMAVNGRVLLVHEAVHIWQGHTSLMKLEYVAKSAFAQCVSIATTGSPNSAYVAQPGKSWSSYGPEQQAALVHTWVASGMLPIGPIFPYIRDNIRTGKNY